MIKMILRGLGFARGLLLMAGVGCPWPGMGQDATPRQDATPEVVTVTDREAVLRLVGPRGRDGRAGHPGRRGGRGEDGRAGHPGAPGPDVTVWMAREPEGRRWLRLRVETGGRILRYALDPVHGALAIQTVGGAGGRGGKGGGGASRGFDGASGGTGRGGPIRVTVTPEAKPFLDRLHLSSPGGPEPVILEGPWPFAD